MRKLLSFKDLKQEAIKRNMTITTTVGALDRGINVYMHPVGVDINKMRKWRRSMYFVSWFPSEKDLI